MNTKMAIWDENRYILFGKYVFSLSKYRIYYLLYLY